MPTSRLGATPPQLIARMVISAWLLAPAARVSIDAATAASKDVVLSIQWYLSQRRVRSDLVEALLDAVAITPKGHPSPADILAATISGLHEGGSAITAHVATLDVTETGTW